MWHISGHPSADALHRLTHMYIYTAIARGRDLYTSVHCAHFTAFVAQISNCFDIGTSCCCSHVSLTCPSVTYYTQVLKLVQYFVQVLSLVLSKVVHEGIYTSSVVECPGVRTHACTVSRCTRA